MTRLLDNRNYQVGPLFNISIALFLYFYLFFY